MWPPTAPRRKDAADAAPPVPVASLPPAMSRRPPNFPATRTSTSQPSAASDLKTATPPLNRRGVPARARTSVRLQRFNCARQTARARAGTQPDKTRAVPVRWEGQARGHGRTNWPTATSVATRSSTSLVRVEDPPGPPPRPHLKSGAGWGSLAENRFVPTATTRKNCRASERASLLRRDGG